jgi:hypothetical protein
MWLNVWLSVTACVREREVSLTNRRSIVSAVAFAVTAICRIAVASKVADEGTTIGVFCSSCGPETVRYPRGDEHCAQRNPKS